MIDKSENPKVRTRIKICGITDPESARAVVDLGADALGMVFYEPSPRNLELAQASKIAAVGHPFVTMVGLFVNAERSSIEQVLDRIPLQLLQFHGDESPAFCDSFGLPYVKALRVSGQQNLADQIQSYSSAQAVLLDTYKKGMPGGTGATFNWDMVPEVDQHIILAGGLTAENVGQAISQVKPYAVDTSGGVESAPGVKDTGRIRAFITQVFQADLNSHV